MESLLRHKNLLRIAIFDETTQRTCFRGLDQRYLKFIGLSDDAIDFFWTDPMSHMIEKC